MGVGTGPERPALKPETREQLELLASELQRWINDIEDSEVLFADLQDLAPAFLEAVQEVLA